jgi:hypothetical protein
LVAIISFKYLSFMNFLKVRPMTVTLVGAVLVLIGGFLSAYGTWLESKAGEEQGKILGDIQRQNQDLKSQNDGLQKQNNQMLAEYIGGGFASFDLIGRPGNIYYFNCKKDDPYNSYNVKIKFLNVADLLNCPKDNIGRYSLKYVDQKTIYRPYPELDRHTDMGIGSFEFYSNQKIMHFEIEFLSRGMNVIHEMYFELRVGRCSKSYKTTEYKIDEKAKRVRVVKVLEVVDNGISGFTPKWDSWVNRRYFVGG